MCDWSRIIAFLILVGIMALVCACASGAPKIQDAVVNDGSTSTGGVIGKVDVKALSDEVTANVAGDVKQILNEKNLVGRLEALGTNNDTKFKNVENAINNQGTSALYLVILVAILRGADSFDTWAERKQNKTTTTPQ